MHVSWWQLWSPVKAINFMWTDHTLHTTSWGCQRVPTGCFIEAGGGGVGVHGATMYLKAHCPARVGVLQVLPPPSVSLSLSLLLPNTLMTIPGSAKQRQHMSRSHSSLKNFKDTLATGNENGNWNWVNSKKTETECVWRGKGSGRGKREWEWEWGI